MKSFIFSVPKKESEPAPADLLNMMVETITKHGEYVVYIKEKKKYRSMGQNRYYWGVVIKSLSECESFGGYTKDEIHGVLKYMFFKKSGVDEMPTTTDASTREFENYLEMIRVFAAQDCGVVIPLPNEDLSLYYEHFI